MRHLVFLFFLMNSFLGFTQQTDYVDFKTAQARVTFKDLVKKEIEGVVSYTFEILKDVDSVFIDAKGYDAIKYTLDGEFEGHFYNEKQLIVKYPFKANTMHTIEVVWKTRPKKAMYFIDWVYEEGNKQVWTQGQGKYTSNWLPSFDDMNEKVVFDISVTFDKGYEVVSNGKLTNKQINIATITWYYDMEKPMSSYLIALAIGKYNKKEAYSKSGIPLEMYYYPEDTNKVEPTYRYTKRMFDFLEEEIGVPYPWQNYKQVPVKDFLYAGMENTSTTIFSDAFMIDPIAFVDKNYVNVNAHELAHQWFGDLVTETSGTHHWLQEGFATYYALLAEKEVFGEDYYYSRLYAYAQELLSQDKAKQSTSLLDPKSSSTTFYKKGAWVLHLLRERVGDTAFRKAVKQYLEKHRFKNVETDDFINEVEKASGQDLNEFVSLWLISKELHFDKMMTSMYSNEKIKKAITFDDIDWEIETTEKEVYSSNLSRDLPVLKAFYVDFKSGDPLSKETINYKGKNPINFYVKAFASKDIKTRQAIAQNLTKIPSELKKDYESLLLDKSYATIEAALLNLWMNFPDDRVIYLNKTKPIIGYNDKNVRILWLTLALITDDFESENKKQYFEELINYSSPKYGFEIRQKAFQYLNEIKGCNDACKQHLKQAATHHNWRFKKFARTVLKEQ